MNPYIQQYEQYNNSTLDGILSRYERFLPQTDKRDRLEGEQRCKAIKAIIAHRDKLRREEQESWQIRKPFTNCN